MLSDINEQYDKIYRYCYFRVKNASLAEDLTQETFLRFFSQTSYLNHGKPLAYLYTIAKNLCIDSFRAKQPEPLPDADTEWDSFVMPDTGYQELEAELTVKKAVEALPKELAELILFRFVNELSMKEISNITGMSRFSIQRKLDDALKQLKRILRREDFYE